MLHPWFHITLVIKQQLSTIISSQYAGKRLDKTIVELFDGAYSRSRLSAWVREGLLTLDGQVIVKPGTKLEDGQKLLLKVPEAQVPEPGSDLEPTIIYEDEFLAVINKPAGLPMHANSVGDTQMCVSNWLVAKYGDDLPVCQGQERPGIVHRLDKETSGVCIVSFDDETFKGLQQQFAARTVEKEYHAISYGVPRFKSDWIETRLKADPRKPTKVTTTELTGPGTRDALSYWEVIEYFPDTCLLRIRPSTGRKHQIRVHLCSVELPIVGDPLYRAKNYGAGTLPEDSPLVTRTLLHAYRIKFQHPQTKGELEYSVEYPKEMQNLLAHLRTNNA
jgi:23S rRNA pseudouridine1911/1915/1917 synthase